MRVGSLCTGYGGLDLAVDAVLGTTTEWVCEFDPHASKVCDARFPGVPNLHDLTAVDWSTVPPVDVLTAGYPCQPFSHAGRRQGTDDARHLWPYICDALRVLRPRLAVFENVAGHLSLGFDTVVADLASIGFDAEWTVVRASDVGACHRRARLFIVATDATDQSGEHVRRIASDTVAAGDDPRGGKVQQSGGHGRNAARAPHFGHEWSWDAWRRRAGSEDGGEHAADADGTRLEGRPTVRGGGGERPTRSGGLADAADPEVVHEQREPSGPGAVRAEPRHGSGRVATPDDATGDQGWEQHGERSVTDWGDYAAAIARHEHAIGRHAPAPTDDKGRLSPRFVEWMMMLPAGWVTDVADLSRAQQLKILGNGVVPPQAAYAIDGLLRRMQAWTEAA